MREARDLSEIDTVVLASRLEALCIPEPNSGCWLWTGTVNAYGYGTIYPFGRYGPRIGAHRVSWAVHFGSPGPYLYVCHKCDMPACVNPSHLFLGTPSENARDCAKKGRHHLQKNPGANPLRRPGVVRHFGSDHANSKLTTAEATAILHRRGVGTISELAAQYGVSRRTVSDIQEGKTWKHLGRALVQEASI